MSDEDIGVIYGLLLTAQMALKEASRRLPAPLAGSPRDAARIDIASAQTHVDAARHAVARMEKT